MNKSDDKLDYYATILKKIRNKKYEYLVISRILHLLGDQDIEFTTQQLVRSGDKRYHLDLYFPQLHVAVEIDESYHSNINQVAKDKEREKAVINSVDVQIERIDASGKSFEEVCKRVDEVIRLIKERKRSLEAQGAFVSFGQKYDVDYWKNKKNISVYDDARFRTHVEVANAVFNLGYKRHQRALISLTEGDFVWFPKLYKNDDWDNDLLSDGKKIVQTKLAGGKYGGKKSAVSIGDRMIVFAHHKDDFGQIYYAYKGVFKLKSRKDDMSTYVRCSDELRFDGAGNYWF